FPFDIAKLSQPLPEGFDIVCCRRWSAPKKEADLCDLLRLLRLGGCAKCKEHGAKSKHGDFSLHVFPCSLHSSLDTRPFFHLITLSARASTLGGIVRPICFAVLRLITNSNFIGRSTGRSAGLAPFRILSTYVAARRKLSAMFGA